MHSRKKGKSGSNLVTQNEKRDWVKYNAEETEKLVLKYAKAGNSSSEVGMILRDQHGIPNVKSICNKTILQMDNPFLLKYVNI